METEDALRVVSWKLHLGQRSEPSLEAGAYGFVVDVEGNEEWPPSSSHIGAGLGCFRLGGDSRRNGSKVGSRG